MKHRRQQVVEMVYNNNPGSESDVRPSRQGEFLALTGTRIYNWDECQSRDEDGKQFGRHGYPNKGKFQLSRTRMDVEGKVDK